MTKDVFVDSRDTEKLLDMAPFYGVSVVSVFDNWGGEGAVYMLEGDPVDLERFTEDVNCMEC